MEADLLAASAHYGFSSNLPELMAGSQMGWVGSKGERKIISFGEKGIIKISI